MGEKNFENAEKEIIKWFLKKDIPTHLRGFDYCTYILAKRLIGEWDKEKMIYQYTITGEHFGVSGSRVERCVRNFIEKSNDKKIKNSEYLAKIFYLIKLDEEIEETEEI